MNCKICNRARALMDGVCDDCTMEQTGKLLPWLEDDSKEVKIELKPCPFCEGEVKLIEIGNDFTKKRSVEIICRKCSVIMKNSALRNNMEWLIDVSVKNWNMRNGREDRDLIQLRYTRPGTS